MMNLLEYLAYNGAPEDILREVTDALAAKDAEIAALKKRVQELENASVSCEGCGWAQRALEVRG